MLGLGKQLEREQLSVLSHHLNKEVEQRLNEIFERKGWITTAQFIFDHSMWVEWQAPNPALNEVYKAKYYYKNELFLEVTRRQSLAQREGAITIVVTQELTTPRGEELQ